MEQEKLKEILDLHKKWLNGEPDGVRADLSNANLSNADLSDADLSDANLVQADLQNASLIRADLRNANLRNAALRNANLTGAYLVHANLSTADLSDADLTGADLTGAGLIYANLSNADLRNADLRNANLSNADLSNAKNIPFLPQCEICPSEGAFIGWKKVNNFIVKLQIPEDAKRSSATTRKCRCDKALVLAIQNIDGRASVLTEITNYNYNPPLTYKVGEMVYPDSFDDNRWEECSNGIHFFITRQEAVDY